MKTTTLVLNQAGDEEVFRRAGEVLESDPGVARVLVRADRGKVYVRHSAARASRGYLLGRLREEGIDARVDGS